MCRRPPPAFLRILCGLLLLALPGRLPAEEEPAEEAGAETILVRARPVVSDAVAVELIDEEQLERLADDSTAAALERLGAVHGASGRRGERGLQLRGFSQRQVAVMLDGVPLALPFDGQLSLDWLPADWVRQIQIVKGPGSLQFGPNGVGGAINLLTREAGAGATLNLDLRAADLDRMDLGVHHAQRLGSFAWSLSAGYRRLDGFRLSRAFEPTANEDGGLRENSDSELAHGMLRVGWRSGIHRLGLSAWRIEGERGMAPSTRLSRPRYWRFGLWRAQGLALRHAWRLPAGLGRADEVIWLRSYANRVDGFDDANYDSQLSARAFSSRYDDLSLGLRLRARGLVDSGLGAWIWRAWLGLQHDQHLQDEGVALSRSLLTLAPELDWLPSERWLLSASVQGDLEFAHEAEDQSAQQAWSLGPLLAAKLSLFSELHIQLSAALRSRFPNLKERFDGLDGIRLANPDLKAESAWHFGLEASWRPRKTLWLKWAGFDAELIDRIENRPVTGADGLPAEQLQNLGRARMFGMEFLGGYQPWDLLALRLSYQFLHARRLDEDEPLAYRPAHRLILGVDIEPVEDLVFSTDIRLVGPQDFLHPETLAWGILGTYLLWDARLRWQANDWLQLYLKGSNLLDAQYMTEFGFPDPGLELWLGLRLTAA